MKKLNKILLDYLIEEEIGNSELIKNIDDLNDADNLENLEKILSDEQKRTEIDLKISKQNILYIMPITNRPSKKSMASKS